MGEGLRGSGRDHHDKMPVNFEDLEAIKIEKKIFEIMALLAGLIEGGGELTKQQKQAKSALIQVKLHNLGLTDISQLVELQIKLLQKLLTLPSAQEYPTKEEFKASYDRIISEPKDGNEVTRSHVFASDVSSFAHSEWKIVDDRTGRNVVTDYLYDLGLIMHSPFHYTHIFDESDSIQLGPDWSVENGRHRSLVLRILGPEYVERTGMDNWVKVEKAK